MPLPSSFLIWQPASFTATCNNTSIRQAIVMVAHQSSAVQMGSLGMALRKCGDALVRFTTSRGLWRIW